ncbi:hypothetical protein HMPREF0762_01887 [Slackia exigua ATCC 700122]|uniref:Uncharacterized protein n=1 Tax=Slackia exigua (strain ATCC 700122 / DSM 15923 / CIP 105133 / JCM 11022 / KCTC 5966 / S-7) TaxID=649764 RepID=D0WJ61_SLAES|nr:hypothetical protein HMPREF0762_01887 [Slackia exigua ATCC 700122]
MRICGARNLGTECANGGFRDASSARRPRCGRPFDARPCGRHEPSFWRDPRSGLPFGRNLRSGFSFCRDPRPSYEGNGQ